MNCTKEDEIGILGLRTLPGAQCGHDFGRTRLERLEQMLARWVYQSAIGDRMVGEVGEPIMRFILVVEIHLVGPAHTGLSTRSRVLRRFSNRSSLGRSRIDVLATTTLFCALVWCSDLSSLPRCGWLLGFLRGWTAPH